MSSKRKRRFSMARPVAPRPNSPSAKSRRVFWIMLLAVGMVVLAGAGFLAKRHWGHPAEAEVPERAQSDIRKAAPVEPSAPRRNDAGKDQAFISQVNRGNELLSQGKPAEAAQVFTEAMRLNPEDEDVHYNLALALTRLGKTDDAIREYGEALRILPDYAEAHNNLGNLLMRIGQTNEAIAHLERAIKIMPDYASGHNNLGTALQKVGQTNEALLHFQQAVKLNPDYWQAHFNLAMSCLAQGRTSEGRSELEAVLRLQPGFQPAKAALAEIDARAPAGTAPKPN